jgi:hypothetical protein
MPFISLNPVGKLLVWRGHSCPRNAYRRVAFAGNICSSLLAFAVMAALTSQAVAQHASAPAPAHSAAPHFNPPLRNFALARNPHGSRRSSHVPPLTSLPFPFFDDSFNPDDIDSSGNPAASPPPPFLMQAMRDMTGSAASSMGQTSGPLDNRGPSSSQPLMIELQNGRYVRVDSTPVNGEALPLPLAPSPAPPKTTGPSVRINPSPQISAASSPTNLPAAVLIFHDGHSEEVRDYTIADGFLYARGDYYADGYWNKKIDLATLDLTQTQQANATRNVKFALPASPNEVITRF